MPSDEYVNSIHSDRLHIGMRCYGSERKISAATTVVGCQSTHSVWCAWLVDQKRGERHRESSFCCDLGGRWVGGSGNRNGCD